MTDPMTFDDMAVEHRQTAILTPHAVRQDLYDAMTRAVEDAYQEYGQAVTERRSEAEIEGLRDTYSRTKKLAVQVADDRVSYVVRRSLFGPMTGTDATPEERELSRKLVQMINDFKAEVLKI